MPGDYCFTFSVNTLGRISRDEKREGIAAAQKI